MGINGVLWNPWTDQGSSNMSFSRASLSWTTHFQRLAKFWRSWRPWWHPEGKLSTWCWLIKTAEKRGPPENLSGWHTRSTHKLSKDAGVLPADRLTELVSSTLLERVTKNVFSVFEHSWGLHFLSHALPWWLGALGPLGAPWKELLLFLLTL